MNKSAFRILAAGILTFLCVCAGNAAETSVKIAPGRSVIVAKRPFRKAAEELQRHLELISGVEHFFYRPNQHHYFQCPYLPIGSEWLERYVIFHAMQDPGRPFSYWEGDIAGIEGLLGIKYKKDARK